MSTARIAVVGMACHYADAHEPAELWQTVLGSRRAFRRIPEQRLSHRYRSGSAHHDDPDSTYVQRAAVLEGWHFDRRRFSVPRASYEAADQTHWLALATAEEALEDAGLPRGDGLDRDAVGVVLGNSLAGEFTRAALLRYRWPFLEDTARGALAEAGVSSDLAQNVLERYEGAVKQRFPAPGDESLAGGLANTIAGRVCNYFDFHGSGFTVDGACSSSLLAVIQAARALTSGELDVALCGGVDLSLDPFELVGFARLGALSTGEMRVYDSAPTGFLPGEGCGILVLTTEQEARRRDLRVYGYLTGWGSSSDGAGGLTRPESAGQELALRRAYRSARTDPGDVELIEGHGTGTGVGDRVEIEALAAVRTSAAPSAALGSVKANIGHTKAAAGVAGLIKALIAVDQRVIPPTTACPNPHTLLADTAVPLRVVREAEAWASATPRAGVSAFGFGGINTHVVVEGATRPPRVRVSPSTGRWARRQPTHVIMAVHAPTIARLRERLDAVRSDVAGLSPAEAHDLAATAWASRRGTDALRCVLVGRGPDEVASAAGAAADRLDLWNRELVVDHTAGFTLGAGTVAHVGLMFPGQAAPVRPELAGWARSLDVPALTVDTSGADPTATEVAQQVIVRQCLAGVAWLRALGCEPTAAIGHSLGEIAALIWAGCWAPTAGTDLVAVRGRLMSELGASPSAMVGLAAGRDDAEQLVDGTRAVVAAVNAPGRTVIAGAADDVAVAVARAQLRGLSTARLSVSHGFHSPAMCGVADAWRDHLRAHPPTAPATEVISTVTGSPLTGADDLVEVLVDQLTRPVEFQTALAALASRVDLLVEVGPGRMLADLARTNAAAIPVVSLDCAGPEDGHALATAALHAAGAGDLSVWFAGFDHRHRVVGQERLFLHNPCDDERGPPATEEVRAVVETPVPRAASDRPDPLELIQEHLSVALDLPQSAITPTSSVLSDLHVGSLQLVRIVADVAGRLGLGTPAVPADGLAGVSVAELAELVSSLPEETTTATIDGVAPWVRPFGHEWISHEATDVTPARSVVWTVLAPAGHWMHDAVGHGHDDGPDAARGMAVILDNGDDVEEIATVLRTVGERQPELLLVVHHGHPAAMALARSAAAEVSSCATTVVELPVHDRTVDPDIATSAGCLELRRRDDGVVERRRTVAVHPGARQAPSIGPGEVCLVTGGVEGITLRSALRMAEDTGAGLVVLGRRPVGDADLRAAVGSSGVPVHYVACDVVDPASVEDALAEASRYGPVRGLIHGAAVNEPRKLSAVTADSLARIVGPKVDGLRTLLAAVGDRLTLAVAYSSIIGRAGLEGQSEYCIANDWMRVLLEAWAADHPECRCRVLEWSLWSDLGMGTQLGVVETLSARGIVPIDPERGAQALVDALDVDGLPTTVLLSGRFPAGAGLTVDGPRPELRRFQEEVLSHTPGVEVVLETGLTTASDPYLDEHRIDGVAVLPGVVGLEAMAEAAAAVVGDHGQWCVDDIGFTAAVLVDDHETRTVRVAGLVRPCGEAVDLELRSDQDGYAAVDLRGAAHAAGPPPPDTAPPPRSTNPIDARGLYEGPLFFHRGRFRRAETYETLSALHVEAWITDDASPRSWFSEYHRSDLMLGDLGALDTAIHLLLACAPHRRALPIGADRLTVWRRPDGPVHVVARERHHTADDYVFDVDLTTADGASVARWEGLALHATVERPWDRPLPFPLVAPVVSRRMIEAGLPHVVDLAAAVPPSDGRGDGGELVVVSSDVAAGVDVRAVEIAADGGAAGDDVEEATRAALERIGVSPGPVTARDGHAPVGSRGAVLDHPEAHVFALATPTDRGPRLVTVATPRS